ncbi:hypothetical protein SK128_017837, partial [Halocaridina rubra]
MLSFLNTDSNTKAPNHQSDTWWGAHAKAVSAINVSYKSIMDALNYIYANENEKGDTRLQA